MAIVEMMRMAPQNTQNASHGFASAVLCVLFVEFENTMIRSSPNLSSSITRRLALASIPPAHGAGLLLSILPRHLLTLFNACADLEQLFHCRYGYELADHR